MQSARRSVCLRFFDPLVGLHREQQKIREGVIDHRAVIPKIVIGIDILGQPYSRVLSAELDRSVVDRKVHLSHICRGDGFHQACLQVYDFAGILAGILRNPCPPLEFRGIGYTLKTKGSCMTWPILTLLEMYHPSGLAVPFRGAFALHFIVALKVRKKDQRHLGQSDVLGACGQRAAATFRRAILLHREPSKALLEIDGVIERSFTALQDMSHIAKHLVFNFFLGRKVLKVGDQLIGAGA